MYVLRLLLHSPQSIIHSHKRMKKTNEVHVCADLLESDANMRIKSEPREYVTMWEWWW